MKPAIVVVDMLKDNMKLEDFSSLLEADSLQG